MCKSSLEDGDGLGGVRSGAALLVVIRVASFGNYSGCGISKEIGPSLVYYPKETIMQLFHGFLVVDVECGI